MWTELGSERELSVPAGCKHQPWEGGNKGPGNRVPLLEKDLHELLLSNAQKWKKITLD